MTTAKGSKINYDKPDKRRRTICFDANVNENWYCQSNFIQVPNSLVRTGRKLCNIITYWSLSL